MVLVTSLFNHVYTVATCLNLGTHLHLCVISVFMYVSYVRKRAVKVLVKLHICASSSEPSLHTNSLVPDPNRDRIMRRVTSTVIIMHHCPFLKRSPCTVRALAPTKLTVKNVALGFTGHNYSAFCDIAV